MIWDDLGGLTPIGRVAADRSIAPLPSIRAVITIRCSVCADAPPTHNNSAKNAVTNLLKMTIVIFIGETDLGYMWRC
jgi:hypothetical protein